MIKLKVIESDELLLRPSDSDEWSKRFEANLDSKYNRYSIIMYIHIIMPFIHYF